VGLVRITPLGRLWQNLPANQQAYTIENNRNHYDISFRFSELQVRAVHRENSVVPRLRHERENQRLDLLLSQDTWREKRWKPKCF
jgi:hypothetical protein